MVQNHMLQLVALTAMEPPIDFTADAVRNEKVKVLKAMHTPGPKHSCAASTAGARRRRGGARLPRGGGRRPESMTETYVAAKLSSTTGAGRHAVLRAHGQAPSAAGDADRDPVQARAAPAFDERRRDLARTCSSSTSSRTRASPSDRREGARHGMTSGTVHMDFGYRGTFGTNRRRPTSGCSSTRCTATRRSSHGATRSRSSGRSSTRSSPRGLATALPSPAIRRARGARDGGRAHAARRQGVATALSVTGVQAAEWSARKDVSIGGSIPVTAALHRLRSESAGETEGPDPRTSGHTISLRFRPDWQEGGRQNPAGLGDRHPSPASCSSRTRLGHRRDRREVSVLAFPLSHQRTAHRGGGDRAASSRYHDGGTGQHRHALARHRSPRLPALSETRPSASPPPSSLSTSAIA